MEKFDFNGRSYKVVNGLAHNADTAILHPVYKGDNVLLDAYCKELGVELYNRPSGTHAYGNQSGQRGVTSGRLSGGEDTNPVEEKCPTAEAVGLHTICPEGPHDDGSDPDPDPCPECGSTNTELDPMPVESEYTCLDCGFVFVGDDDDDFSPNAILD